MWVGPRDVLWVAAWAEPWAASRVSRSEDVMVDTWAAAKAAKWDGPTDGLWGVERVALKVDPWDDVWAVPRVGWSDAVRAVLSDSSG